MSSKTQPTVAGLVGARQINPSSSTVGINCFPLPLKIGFWICLVIAVAAVFRRLITLGTESTSSAPPQLATLDAYFQSHATLTYVHILCALAFVCLLPLLFWRRTQKSALLEKMFFGLGVIVGCTAYAMSIHAIGGWLERSAVVIFDTLFLIALALAYIYRRRGDQDRKRRWMVRAIAILLGIATTRPVMGIFFATSRFTHLTPQQFFGVAFWIGFSVNAVVIELWLRNRRLNSERTRL